MRSFLIFSIFVAGICLARPAAAQDEFIKRSQVHGWYTPDSLKQGTFLTYLDKDFRETDDDSTYWYYRITRYKDGKPTGIARTYTNHRLLVNDTKYNNGKLTQIRTYHTNEKLYKETFYGDGKKTGFERTYYPSGILQLETPYLSGVKNGVEKEYFTSGKLNRETPYVNGKEEGVEKLFYEGTGDLMSQTTYVGGRAQHAASATKSVHRPVRRR